MIVLHGIVLATLLLLPLAVPTQTSTYEMNISSTNGGDEHSSHLQAGLAAPAYETRNLPPGAFFGHTEPLNGTLLSKRGTTNSLTLETFDDANWQGRITVGSRTFQVGFDTGSFDLVLLGPDCKACKGKVTYKLRKKYKYNLIDPTYQTQFSGHTYKAKVYSAIVRIAGLRATKNPVVALSELGPFANPNFARDGLVGLRLHFSDTANMPPLFQTLASRGRIKEPIFSFLLRRGQNCYSELSFDSINPAIPLTAIQYVPVLGRDHWTVQFAISVDGVVAIESQRAIMSTGVAFIVGSPDAVRQVYESIGQPTVIPSSTGFVHYLVPCDFDVPISFSFGASKRSFVIPPAHFIEKYNGGCFGTILGKQDIVDWVVGTPFLSSVYAVFDARSEDYHAPRIGFAEVPEELRCTGVASSSPTGS